MNDFPRISPTEGFHVVADMMDDPSRGKKGESRAEFVLQEKLRPLLQEILAGVRHHRETPLLAGFDSNGIAHAALQSLSTSAPTEKLHYLQDLGMVITVLNLLVQRALLEELDHADGKGCIARTKPGNDTFTRDLETSDETALHPLALWLEHFYTVMCDVHPKAIEIVGLRVENCTNREVVQRLGLSLRLVKRIVRDTQRAWESAVGKD